MQITQWLTDQHDFLRKRLTDLDALVSKADKEAVKTQLHEILALLDEHEMIETKVVYPAAQKLEKSGDFLIAQFHDDHDQLKDLVARIRGSQEGEDLLRFSSFVRAHMNEEESYLYPIVEEHLTEEQDEIMMGEVRTILKSRETAVS